MLIFSGNIAGSSSQEGMRNACLLTSIFGHRSATINIALLTEREGCDSLFARVTYDYHD